MPRGAPQAITGIARVVSGPRTVLAQRAQLCARIRGYFAAHAVLEVTTPTLVPFASSEPTVANLALARTATPRYLRTSPEAALKRLVAAGSGDVFELGAVFRAAEHGRLHREQFTLLEWYRVGFDHLCLMDDVAALLRHCGYTREISRVSYAELFAAVYGADPHTLSTAALAQCADRAGVALTPVQARDRAGLFDALYVAGLERELARRGAVFVHEFPRTLRAYARLDAAVPPRAQRFELVIDGIEIANGYHEITDAQEQAACFAAELALRERRGLPPVTVDDDWLAALACGMPACAGVALGLERLLMALRGARDIEAVCAL